MALIDITPKMTSNTEPSPYMVSASSILNTTYDAYKAFNSSIDDIYHSASGVQQWIKIDFGSSIKVSAFSISAQIDMSFNGTPKYFILYGSNDDKTYEKIHQEENEINWIAKETRIYKLKQDVFYRYYKLSIVNTVTYAYVTISEIHFYQDDGVTPPSINAKYQTQKRSLPHGSKLRLDNLTSDLPYMLAVEDDGINEGTFRLVNHAGKFIIPKASTKVESLWKGNITKDGIAVLLKSIKDFTLIIIEITSENGLINYVSVPVRNIILNKTDYLTSIYWIPTYYSSGRYGFLTEYTFTITDSANVGMGAFNVTEIIGVY